MSLQHGRSLQGPGNSHQPPRSQGGLLSQHLLLFRRELGSVWAEYAEPVPKATAYSGKGAEPRSWGFSPGRACCPRPGCTQISSCTEANTILTGPEEALLTL